MNQIREEAVRTLHGDASQTRESKSRDVQQLILVSLALWRATRDTVASRPATDRAEKREAAAMLRSAEQAMASVSTAADALADTPLNQLNELKQSLRVARRMILMPTARHFAEHDSQKRSADELADFLLDRVQFLDGRPVISDELAGQLPDPFGAEPVGS